MDKNREVKSSYGLSYVETTQQPPKLLGPTTRASVLAGVQTDATTPKNLGTCSASWERNYP